MTKPADPPIPFHQVLREELDRIGKPLSKEESAAAEAAADAARAARDAAEADARTAIDDVRRAAALAAAEAIDPDAAALKSVAASLGRRASDDEATAALCFSGGGIRSATFNLGVLQALARNDLLKRFDYLSSVSGGGFIAGWFKAWAGRDGFDAAAKALQEGPGRDPHSQRPEPKPITHLRDFSNYLTPRTGLLSADTWTLVALTARNLFLNWLVLIPALMCLVAIPQVSLLVAAARDDVPAWFQDAPFAGLLLGLFASASANYFRRRRDHPPREPVIVLWTLLPLWFAALFLSLGALWVDADLLGSGRFTRFCVLWTIVMPITGWFIGSGVAWLARAWAAHHARRKGCPPAPHRNAVPPFWMDLPAILIAGSASCLTLLTVGRLWLPRLQAHPPIFVVVLVPLLLGLYLLSRALFVALTTWRSTENFIPETANADREWWARLSAWLLIAAAAWMVASALVVLGAFYFDRITNMLLAATGGATGLLTAILGASTRTGATGDAEPAGRTRLLDLALKALAPVTLVLVVIALAGLNGAIAGRFVRFESGFPLEDLSDCIRLQPGTSLFEAMLAFSFVPLLALAGAFVLGWFVNVNVFSAQGLYRNRLVRAYLGASRSDRQSDPFTGFDPDDNTPLWKVDGRQPIRPLLVINAALNLVQSAERLAWQQRKAESFTMTPLHCGNARLDYRSSARYGGALGISLGTAITISGAAANPNSGYHSSPLIGFLMTLFNARLGSWLGNPGDRGARVYRKNGPRHAWLPLFGDLLGFSDSKHPYVCLSDGGHFENLGLYEMVQRRCRFIVVSDAGCDPGHTFEDLGNAIRKVRIDLGVPITFPDGIPILARRPAAEGGLAPDPTPTGEASNGAGFAVGRIGYDEVDAGARPGYLLYLKPTLRASACLVPRDVRAYAEASLRFPHEPTSDQWFSESQFESYRALGDYLASEIPGVEAWKAPEKRKAPGNGCPPGKTSPASPVSPAPARPASDAGPGAAPGA